jgi:signal transduction histidine kinase
LWWAFRKRRSLRQSLQAYVVCAVLLGPVAGAVIGATTATVIGDASSWLSIAGKWWLGDALGVLVVATPILAWSTPRTPYESRCPPVEAIAITVVAALVTVLPALLWDHPLLYAVLPVLTWAAFRGGVRAVSVAGVGVAFAADWAAVTGRAGEIIVTGSPAEQLAYVQLFIAVTLLVALMLAIEIAERRRAEHASRIAEADRRRAEVVAGEAAEEERRRIARETHDIVGHALNVMVLQAGAARRVSRTDVDQSQDLLESIEAVGRDAFRDLDIALGLTDKQPDLLAGRGLSSVPSLVHLMRQTGMTIDLEVTGERNGAVPTLVDWSAFRIIQEAMTNVTKYAPRAHTEVIIRYQPDEIVLAVVDDGAGSVQAQKKEGRGLIGMRERVAALGGDIAIGPNGGPGFAVRASLPLRTSS